MLRLTNWTARRSGAFITVTGIDADTKVVVRQAGVDRIQVKSLDGRIGVFAESDGDADIELTTS